MKVKVGYSTGYEDTVLGELELDSQDIIDLNFKNANSSNIYFFNLKNKLTFNGLMKVQSKFPSFNQSSDYNFVYIISEKELTAKQIEYQNRKRFVNYVINEMKKNNNDICPAVLEHNGWILYKDEILDFEYDDYTEYFRICDGKRVHLKYGKYVTNSFRKWSCHIDNADCNSIAYIEIDTIDQFNTLMQLMDLDYTLYNI